MGMFMKGIGKMTKLMEKEYIDIKTDRLMLGSGFKMCNMVTAYKNLHKELFTKGIYKFI